MTPDTHIAITGTREGMTPEQRHTLQVVLDKFRGWFHHGDCIGVDEQAHNIARRAGYRIIIHPPKDPKFRAYCKTEPGWMFIEHDYLERNRIMVMNSKRLIVVPKTRDEEERSGTWSTYRFAVKRDVPTKIILPNGKVRTSENW